MSKPKETRHNLKELNSQFVTLRGRVDKYLKEMKELRKILNRSENISSPHVLLRRIELMEAEIDAMSSTLGYYQGSDAGQSTSEFPRQEKDEEPEDKEISGFDLSDKVIT